MPQIKPVLNTEISKLKNVIDSCGLFPSEYLDNMIADYLNNPNSTDLWYASHVGNDLVGFIYCIPEKFTTGTNNLLAIGVSETHQRKGIAKNMLSYIEQELINLKASILIIETSSDDAQKAARFLYEQTGYTKEAVIREFWNENEDKIIYRKKLNHTL